MYSLTQLPKCIPWKTVFLTGSLPVTRLYLPNCAHGLTMLLSETSADTVSFAEKRRDLTFLSGVYFGLSRGSPDSKSTAATPSMNPVITAMVDAGVILLVNVGAR